MRSRGRARSRGVVGRGGIQLGGFCRRGSGVSVGWKWVGKDVCRVYDLYSDWGRWMREHVRAGVCFYGMWGEEGRKGSY